MVQHPGHFSEKFFPRKMFKICVYQEFLDDIVRYAEWKEKKKTRVIKHFFVVSSRPQSPYLHLKTNRQTIKTEDKTEVT